MADSFLKSLVRKFTSLGIPQYVLGGSFLSSAPKGGIGYGTGAGSTVTQATSKVTAFTLDTATGRIILAAGALAGYATTSSATWTNSAIGSYDTVVFSQNSGTIGAYTFNAICSNGTAQFTITNVTSASLNEAVAVEFNVIKGSQS